MDEQQDHPLHYVTEHRLVICKPCGYAVQPNAISNHLKEKHHIYRQDRQRILKHIEPLELAEPGDIVLPGSDHAPVPYLPIDPGFACSSYEACGYMAITLKRMRMHWSKTHGRAACDEVDWRRVHLQTFFRGTHLRYFEVTKPVPDAAITLLVDDLHTAAAFPADDEALQTGRSKAPQLVENSAEIDRLRNAKSFTLEDLQIWHHYVTSTSSTLCHSLHLADYLAVKVTQMSGRCLCLVRLVLALTSLHLAYLDPCQKEKYTLMAKFHHLFSLASFHDMEKASNSADPQLNSAFYKLLAMHQFALVSLDRPASIDTEDGDILAKIVIAIRSGYSWITLDPTHVTGLSKSMLGDHENDAPYVDERQCQFTKRFAFSAGFPETNVEQDRICYDAFRELQRANALVKTPTMWLLAFVLWPSQVSDSYLQLLSVKQPTSLLILGHFCTIVKILDRYWYMSGHASWLLGLIRRLLDVKYHGMLPQITN